MTLSDDETRYLLWWQILRPDRLRTADEITRLARRYKRAKQNEAADALDNLAAWLRASAGEVGEPADEPSLDVVRRLFGDAS